MLSRCQGAPEKVPVAMRLGDTHVPIPNTQLTFA